MKIIVKPHQIKIIRNEDVNEKEINISKCKFEFDERITNEFTKEAYFTLNGNSYKQIIVNDECDFPSEILEYTGNVEIGVVAYKIDNNKETRFNPTPRTFPTKKGSLKGNVENSSTPTPSEIEQITSLLNSKQDELISGTNIKTINNQSILGSGNINIEGGSGGTSTDVQINGSSITSSGTANIVTEGVYNASTNKIATMSDVPDVTGKQDTLVSGTNIKTINGSSILGSGNINISGGEAISVGNIQFDLVEEGE